MTDDRSHQDADFADEERSGGHPLIATLVCAVLLILAAAGRSGPQAGLGPDYVLGYIAGGGVFGGILWGIAYAITIKRSSTAWRVTSLIVLVVIGLLSTLLQIGARAVVRHSDVRDTENQLQQVLDGDTLPQHVAAGSGPLSRMSAAFLNRSLADQRALERDLAAVGFEQVVSLEGLTRSSPVLRHCADFAPIAARARHLGVEGRRANLAAARQVGDAAVQAGQLSAQDETAFFEGAEQSRTAYERQWTLNAEVVEEAQAVCTLLASREWVLSGERVLFTRPGDAEAVNAHLRRIQAHGAEQERMRDTMRTRTRQRIEASHH